jgi:hypothetical protein
MNLNALTLLGVDNCYVAISVKRDGVNFERITKTDVVKAKSNDPEWYYRVKMYATFQSTQNRKQNISHFISMRLKYIIYTRTHTLSHLVLHPLLFASNEETCLIREKKSWNCA